MDDPPAGRHARSGGDRRLYNPLPAPVPPPDEPYLGPEPPGFPWRLTVGLVAVLAAGVGFGLWVTWPDAPPPGPVSSSVSVSAGGPVSFEPLVRSPAPTLSPRRKATPTPSASHKPTPTRSTEPPRVRRTPKPTVTVTKKVTVTPKPTKVGTGPEEPPDDGSGPAPTCRTWSDCHDEPPGG
ncbi:hypothetical protein ACIBG8_37130 [Nonomuraea sp. NPDC050556]|uniref:hypothetical protein n=1 Tax=Nonomuraea sp. NPDC050556 TaxID=3364369 RepID=UPI0037B0C1E9